MTYVSSRIPLQVAAPSKRRRSRLLPWIGVGLVTSAAIGITTLTWTGAAHAERSTTSTVAEASTAPATPAPSIHSIYDVQNDLNRLRAEKRLGPLVFDSILTQTAGTWANTLADENRLRHDPQLVAGYQDGWTTLSESISAGSTMDDAYAGVIGNQRQAAQIFNEQTNTAGVGLATKNGQAYLVVRFAAQNAE